MSIDSIHTPLRKTAAGLLLSVLVWICLAPLALAFVPQSTDCGMRCCRIKKSCCCRKAPHARQKQPAISARTSLTGRPDRAALRSANQSNTASSGSRYAFFAPDSAIRFGMTIRLSRLSPCSPSPSNSSAR